MLDNLRRVPQAVVTVRNDTPASPPDLLEALAEQLDPEVLDAVEEFLRPPDRATTGPSVGVRAAGEPGVALFLDSSGEPTASFGTTTDFPLSPSRQAVLDGTVAVTLDTVAVNGEDFRVAFARLDNGLIAQVAQSVEGSEQALARLATVLVGVTLGSALLGALAGLAVSRTALRPVVDLTASAESMMAASDLSARLPVEGSDEVARLATSFNGVLESLAEALERQQRLVADASHELRTPLSSVRANVEVLQRDRLPASEKPTVLTETVTQLDELTHLVANLVDLARGEEPGGEPATVDLTAVVVDAVARARRGHPRVTFVVQGDGGEVIGVADRLSRAVGNMLDNAGKFSPEGGEVRVCLSPGEVHVSDDGPGVAPEDHERVFDRFWRAATAQGIPGSGLGLAIVAEVARSHGGRVDVGGNGQGATFTLALPTA